MLHNEKLHPMGRLGVRALDTAKGIDQFMGKANEITIAFSTANLVAQFSGYRFHLEEWGLQERKVIEGTNVLVWNEICDSIRRAGFEGVEIWVAHVDRCARDAECASKFVAAMRDHELTPVALAGGMTQKNVLLAQRLGVDAICGGYWGSDQAESIRLMRQSGVLYNYENHAEKSIDEIRNQISLGASGLAIALDTGWLGTQAMDAPAVVRALGRLIRHVHLKDVAAEGAHHTVKLGTGVVDIPGVIRELKTIGYSGVLSWEDEPEDRNPFDIAAEMREYIHGLWYR